MAEELKELIEKIQEEGIKAAEQRAAEIENDARRNAAHILEKAGRESEQLVSEARDKISKMEESARESLRQAGRDLLLSLRKEINTVLKRLMVSDVRPALDPAQMADIVKTLIKGYGGREKKDITVLVSKEDFEKLEKIFISGLSAETQKGITLKPSEDVAAGFLISYDKEKSHYDFTDKAIVEYISSYINPKLAEILKESSEEPEKS